LLPKLLAKPYSYGNQALILQALGRLEEAIAALEKSFARQR
jgi:hypothetical protein